MSERRRGESEDEKDRIIFPEHRQRGGGAGGRPPARPLALLGAEKTVNRDWPSREQHLVGTEALSVKLVKWREQKKQERGEPLIAGEISPRDEVSRIEADGGVDHGKKLKRPVRGWEEAEPERRNQRSELRVLVVTQARMAPPGIDLDEVRV